MKYRIFIVEDDETIANLLKKHLSSWGYDVFLAEDFSNILQEFAGKDPQLVLLDLKLPFYNGFHWCEEIRKVSQVPVIFISSAADNMNMVMAMSRGADDFIAKPFDMDVLVASNVNRQLPALDDNFGKSKIDAMAERIRQINPLVRLHLIDDFLTTDNVTALLPHRSTYHQLKQAGKRVVILDCVDDMAAKLAIALHCRFNKIPLIMSGGAGGKTDPLAITVSDLKDTYQDPLLAKVRQKLRQQHHINRDLAEKFGIKCVYSTQPPIVSRGTAQTCQTGGLHCGGYGSAVTVTSVVAMVMVAQALQ